MAKENLEDPESPEMTVTKDLHIAEILYGQKLTTVTVSRLYKLYQEETLDGWATLNHLRELTWNAIQCIIFINALMPLVHVLRRSRLE